jgi:hypothetical protein
MYLEVIKPFLQPKKQDSFPCEKIPNGNGKGTYNKSYLNLFERSKKLFMSFVLKIFTSPC